MENVRIPYRCLILHVRDVSLGQKEEEPKLRVSSDGDRNRDPWLQLGDKCIQICHLERYIVGYTVGNLI